RRPGSAVRRRAVPPGGSEEAEYVAEAEDGERGAPVRRADLHGPGPRRPADLRVVSAQLGPRYVRDAVRRLAGEVTWPTRGGSGLGSPVPSWSACWDWARPRCASCCWRCSTPWRWRRRLITPSGRRWLATAMAGWRPCRWGWR